MQTFFFSDRRIPIYSGIILFLQRAAWQPCPPPYLGSPRERFERQEGECKKTQAKKAKKAVMATKKPIVAKKTAAAPKKIAKTPVVASGFGLLPNSNEGLPTTFQSCSELTLNPPFLISHSGVLA